MEMDDVYRCISTLSIDDVLINKTLKLSVIPSAHLLEDKILTQKILYIVVLLIKLRII